MSKFECGEIVKVLRPETEKEMRSYEPVWLSSMESMVGKEYHIKEYLNHTKHTYQLFDSLWSVDDRFLEKTEQRLHNDLWINKEGTMYHKEVI